MKTLIQKWINHNFSSGGVVGDDFKKFFREFKKSIQKECKEFNMELVSINRGHYYISGFLKKKEKYMYFSISDVRHFKDWHKKVYYRTVKHEKDYSRGSNHSTDLDNLFSKMDNLFSE